MSKGLRIIKNILVLGLLILMVIPKSVFADDVVNLRLALWDTEQEPILREILDEYEEKNPHIHVELELTPFGQYWTKLEAAATSQSMADIVWMNGPNFIKYASHDLIAPQDDYLEGIDLADYPQGLVELYQYEGKQYGVPKDWDTTALWYNKEIFDKYDVDYPTSDWTYDDMVQAAEKLTHPEDNIWGVGPVMSTQEGIYNFIHQSGGYIINEDRTESGYDLPESIQGVQKAIDLIEKGYAPDGNIQAETSVRDLFMSGRIAMAYSASWNIPVLMEDEVFAEKIDLTEMPTIEEDGAVVHGLTYALNAQTEFPDEAMEIIKYLAGEEANTKWAESGVVIPAYQPVLETWIDSEPDLNLQAYVDALDYASPYPVSANTSKWEDYEVDALNETFTLTDSVEDSLIKLAERMNQALAEEAE